jgi:hypothetical protein
MNLSFSYRHGPIPHDKRLKYFFGILFYFLVFGAAQTSPFFLEQHNLFSNGPMEKKLYSQKVSTFPYLQENLQKIAMKFDVVGTCQNFQLSLCGTKVL